MSALMRPVTAQDIADALDAEMRRKFRSGGAKALAAAADLPASSVSRYLSGEEIVNSQRLIQLLAALEIPYDDFTDILRERIKRWG